jgi:hypothetical protein
MFDLRNELKHVFYPRRRQSFAVLAAEALLPQRSAGLVVPDQNRPGELT